MARPQPHPILSQLRNARTTPEQTAALRALKNEIVGHVQRKETWVAYGVLEPIVRTIAASAPEELNGKDAGVVVGTRPLTDEVATKLQALQLVDSFSHGGPAFLAPLHAARALPAILSNISPYHNNPQIVVAALRALSDIADAAALADPSSPLDLQSVAVQVFSAQHIESLNAILSVESSKHLLQTQITLTAGLITKLCREEKQQQALAMSGVLDSLATRLASFAVREGFVVPGAEALAKSDGLSAAFPEPAPLDTKLEPILDAIAAILGDSKYRANRLVYAPAILAVFPSGQPLQDMIDSKSETEGASFGSSKNLDLTVMECVLPSIPSTVSRNASSHSSFASPDQSDSQVSTRNNSNRAATHSLWDANSPQLRVLGDSEPEGFESPLVPWLVHLVRSTTDAGRMAAAAVLTALYKAGLGSKSAREISIGLLVVPILVEMIVKNDKIESEGQKPAKGQVMRRTILEQAPLVLARLIIDCEYLQKSAFDCGAVKILTKILKRAYCPVETLNQPEMWSPHPDTDMDAEDRVPTAHLGQKGQNAELAHLVKLRESSLKAIAALAAGKEEYRKALVAEDLVPHVVESLSEFPGKPRSPKGLKDKPSGDVASKTLNPGYGQNPVSVIIAACHTVRTLARSVAILRTAIVDYGAALPIFHFMKHPDLGVQTAATATMVNLVIDVSPVRELLTEKGAMAVLCEHAHSDDPVLRLNALWALKHFIDAVGPELKKSCLEELESGWLIQLIQDDTQDAALYSSRFKGEDMDEDVESQSGDEPHQWVHGTNGIFQVLDVSKSLRLRQAEDRLAMVRETELNPIRKARNDDVAIQEQGLDFIRNFIGRPPVTPTSDTSETADMIDYLFSELGQDRLFEILASKLRPKVLNPFSRRTRMAGREPRVIYPQAQVIVPVIYILVHIAASESRHRQLVVAQTELLRLLAQQSVNKDREVRIALCHLVNNLTWEDEENESESCKQRAQELKKLGFLHKLEMLKQEDRDLDVRERAKEAVYQMELQNA